ncbi:MAG: hypothetical protein AAFY98_10555 [Verrucomicrobiota bacterium]
MNYQWHTTLKEIYDQAVSDYQAGKRGAADFFTAEQIAFLKGIGHTAQEVYDFAEDNVNYGEPDWETFLLIAAVRRDYFFVEMEGKHSDQIVESDTLPPKDAEVEGIVWLPRIIAKAKAKLNGEMNPDLMYGCGGDRKFFNTNKVPPADFLRYVWAADGDDQRVIDFVKRCAAG